MTRPNTQGTPQELFQSGSGFLQEVGIIECSFSPSLETLSFRVSELEHRNVLFLKWNEDVIYVLIQSRLAQPTVRKVASHENPSRQE